MHVILRTAACGLAVILATRAVRADDGPLCEGTLTRSNVAACALSASPYLGLDLASQRAAAQRREAARVWLPSNPVVAGSVASRVGPIDRDTNWSLSLGQQIEIAGQRSLRLDVADKLLRARGHHVEATRARIVAEAWIGYFNTLGIRERVALAERLESATGAVAVTVRAMAKGGIASEVDADIADAAALRVAQERLALESALAAARAHLSVLIGGTLHGVEGELEPIATPRDRATERPETLAAREDRAAQRSKVDLLGRERVPSPTVSLLAQRDGFDERVLGVGVSIPVPLPAPVGRTLAAEIAEQSAIADGADAASAALERELAAERTAAAADLDAATKARALYTEARVTGAMQRLDTIAAEIKAARLAVRDGVIAQQALIEQLKADIDAREWLCLASVRLSRALGSSLEGNSL